MAALAASADRRTSLREQLLGGVFGRADNPFLRFGPVAENDLRRSAPPGDPAERGLSLTVKEGRRRLASFLSGAFKASSLADLASYLQEQFLSLEVRSFAGAKRGTAYLRDMLTGATAPAASVAPNRLSPRGIDRLAGRSVADTSPAGPSATEVRYRDALKVAYHGKPPEFNWWGDLKTGLPAALSRKVTLAYAVEDGVAYIGRPGTDPRKPLECLGSPDATRAMLYGFLAEYHSSRGKHVPPAGQFAALPVERQTAILAKNFVFDRAMAPRTPVLMRDGALAHAGQVHPDLSASALSGRFGEDFSRFWAGFHARQGTGANNSNVLDFHAARRALAAERARNPAAGDGFGGTDAGPEAKTAVPQSEIVIVSDEYSLEPHICRHSADGAHRELPQFLSMHDLPHGVYPHLDMGASRDMPSGYVLVDPHGVTFTDAMRREHRLDGPSHLPAQGGSTRWAVAGERMERSAWQARIAPPDAPDGPGGGDVPQSGFGYGAP